RRLAELDLAFGGRLTTLSSSQHAIEEALATADVVVGGVLVTGGSAPKLITRAMLGRMQPGAVIVDVAIDQGGCAETSHPTTHSNPVFTADGIVHYCVANMPGAVPRTSTFALTNATLPYAMKIAAQGAEEAARQDPAVASGINVYKGMLTNRMVAAAQARAWESLPL
ncbi:MAG TPA: alanine dehydrogenase, partial [Desulfurivibrionaceae bacterium]|nr:alanine dehydrogenase [Desulfurivibrionaceae bacterium]